MIKLDLCDDNFYVCGLRIQGESLAINFVCVYCRPGKIPPKGAWQDILKNINTGEGIIIISDFNAT